MHIAKLIKQYRTEAGLTQQQVADALFVAKNTYNQYENGVRKIDSELFFKILNVLGIQTDFRYEQIEESDAKYIIVYKETFEEHSRFQIELHEYDPIRKRPLHLLNVNSGMAHEGWLGNKEAIEWLNIIKEHYDNIVDVSFLTYESLNKEQLINEVKHRASLTCSTGYLRRLFQTCIEEEHGFVPNIDFYSDEDDLCVHLIPQNEEEEEEALSEFLADVEAENDCYEGVHYLFSYYFDKTVRKILFDENQDTFTILF